MTLFGALFPNIKADDVFHAYDLNIHPCDDCKVCQTKMTCPYNDDDFKKIDAVLRKSDTLILISPVYFGSFSDQLLKIINRFQQYFAQKFSHQKPLKNINHIYVVTTCGAANQNMFAGMKLSLKILESLFEAKGHLFGFTNSDAVKAYNKHYQTLINHYQNKIHL